MAPTALLLLVVERTGDLRPAAVCSLLRSWAMAMSTLLVPLCVCTAFVCVLEMRVGLEAKDPGESERAERERSGRRP